MNIKLKKLIAVFSAAMMLSVFAAGISANDITPHENDDEYYEESPDGGYDEGGYEESSEDSGWESESSAPPEDAESSESTVPSESSKSPISSESSGGVPAGVNSSSSQDEGGAETSPANYVAFGNIGSKSNDIAGYLNTIAIACIALGTVGLVCVIVWTVSTRDIKKKSDDYIYETVGHAQRGAKPPQRRENPYSYNDNYNVNPKSAALQRRQVPQESRVADPKRMQRAEQPRRAQQTGQRPQQRSSQAPQRQQAPQHTVNIPNITKTQRSVRSDFDTDEILNEILRDRKKNN